jgi:hypothetical protein
LRPITEGLWAAVEVVEVDEDFSAVARAAEEHSAGTDYKMRVEGDEEY